MAYRSLFSTSTPGTSTATKSPAKTRYRSLFSGSAVPAKEPAVIGSVPSGVQKEREAGLSRFGIKDTSPAKMSIPENLGGPSFGFSFKSQKVHGDEFKTERAERSLVERKVIANKLGFKDPLVDEYGNINAELNHIAPKALGGTEDLENLDFRLNLRTDAEKKSQANVAFTEKQQAGRVKVEQENIDKFNRGDITQEEALFNIWEWDLKQGTGPLALILNQKKEKGEIDNIPKNLTGIVDETLKQIKQPPAASSLYAVSPKLFSDFNLKNQSTTQDIVQKNELRPASEKPEYKPNYNIIEKLFAPIVEEEVRTGEKKDLIDIFGFVGDKAYEDMNSWEKMVFTVRNAPPAIMRGTSQMLAGFNRSASATLGALEWAGIDKAKPAADKLDEWSDAVQPENPLFIDKLAQGFGSAMFYYLPGMGISKGTQFLFQFSPKVAALFGGSASSLLEAASEAGDTYRWSIKKGDERDLAVNKANFVFAANGILLGLTNRLPFITPEIKNAALRVIASMPMEGVQEYLQQVFQNVAQGDPWDEGAFEAGQIGFLLGPLSGASALDPKSSIPLNIQENFIKSLQELKSNQEGFARLPGRQTKIVDNLQLAQSGINRIIGDIASKVDYRVTGEFNEQSEVGNAIRSLENQIDNIDSPGQLYSTLKEKIGVANLSPETQTKVLDTLKESVGDYFTLLKGTETTAPETQGYEKVREVQGQEGFAALPTEIGEGVNPLSISQRNIVGPQEIQEQQTEIIEAIKNNTEQFETAEQTRLGNFIQRLQSNQATQAETEDVVENLKSRGFLPKDFKFLSTSPVPSGKAGGRQGFSKISQKEAKNLNIPVPPKIPKQPSPAIPQEKPGEITQKRGSTKTKAEIIKEFRQKQVEQKARREFLAGIKEDISKAFAEKKADDSEFLEQLQTDINQAFEKAKGRQRSTISFLRNLGEFNQTVISEIKREIGLDKPLRQASAQQLDKFLTKLKERVSFKRTKGFVPEIERKSKPAPEISEEMYQANREASENNKSTLSERIKNSGEEIRKTSDLILGTISTRLKNIDPSLKRAIRQLEFNILQSNRSLKGAVLPFLEKTKDMSKEDFADFDLALKNGDTKKINSLVEKYGIKSEFDKVRDVLDGLYTRANEVGYDVGYLKNYWPRMIKDTEGFLEHFSNREDWSIIQEAVNRKETALGRYLTVDEKAHLINTMIRGYSGGNITLSETGSMKSRKIDFIDPEVNQFYVNSNVALLRYIVQVNEAIEGRKFFGKHRKTDSKEDQFNNLEDSIGFYVTELLADGKVTPTQEKELRSILQARFGERGTSGLLGIYKNLSYIDVMGSPINALTQLGDLAFPIYNILKGKAGLKDTGDALIKALTNTSKIKKEDLGIKDIAVEFEDGGKLGQLVDRVFKAVGLVKLDQIGKETLVNPIIKRFQDEAENPTREFRQELDDIFGNEIDGSTTEDVLADLRSGVITENVKYLAFNKLADMQPIALSEHPEQYLKGGNGRIFYMLKTWTIKMFDVYRNEVFAQMKTNKPEALKNLMRLTLALVLMNAGADELKDLILGRKTKLSDRVVDNILKLIGFSRYSTYQVAREGLGSTLLNQTVSFPTKFLDNLSKDVDALLKDFDENFNVNKLRSIESIPFGGRLYYWWFGKGNTSEEDKQEKEKKTDTGLPKLPKIGPGLPELPKIPKVF